MLQRQVSRRQLVRVIQKLSLCRVKIKEICSINNCGRKFLKAVHNHSIVEFLLQFVNLFAQVNKNNFKNAPLIYLAYNNLPIPTVSPDIRENHEIQITHRPIHLLVGIRKGVINHLFSIFFQYGLVLILSCIHKNCIVLCA